MALADWAFSSRYSLYTGSYHIGPSSLRLVYYGGVYCTAYFTGLGNMPQGMLDYWRAYNGYFRLVDTVSGVVYAVGPTFPNPWTHFAFRWWQGFDEANVQATCYQNGGYGTGSLVWQATAYGPANAGLLRPTWQAASGGSLLLDTMEIWR